MNIDGNTILKIRNLAKRYQNIPQKYWTETETNKERKVVWILDRQKPSVEQCWDYDEERLGITGEGKIIFGFDSGCSCPAPWYDCGDSVYTEKTWKELELNLSELDNFEGFEMDDINFLDKLLEESK